MAVFRVTDRARDIREVDWIGAVCAKVCHLPGTIGRIVCSSPPCCPAASYTVVAACSRIASISAGSARAMSMMNRSIGGEAQRLGAVGNAPLLHLSVDLRCLASHTRPRHRPCSPVAAGVGCTSAMAQLHRLFHQEAPAINITP
jgi:hypothetical protein